MAKVEQEIKPEEGSDPENASALGENPVVGESSDGSGLFARIKHDQPVGFWVLAALILGLIFL